MDNQIAYKVIWSDEAENSFLKVVDDLLFRWTEREANIFINRTEKLIKQISLHPYLFRAYYKDASIRQAILHKNVTMSYRVMEESQTIRMMLFWATRTSPHAVSFS